MASTNFSNPTQLGLQIYQKFVLKETSIVSRVKSDFARRFNCIYSFKLLKNLHFGVFETKF